MRKIKIGSTLLIILLLITIVCLYHHFEKANDVNRYLQNEVEQLKAENSMLINRQNHQYHFADSTLLLENKKLRQWLSRERQRLDDDASGDYCPLCRNDSIAVILYGVRYLDVDSCNGKKKYVSGGCLVNRSSRRFVCRKCGYEWGLFSGGTIYKDTFLVALRDTVFYDAKWLRRQFETAGKAYWRNYGDGYEVAYPEFMNKVLLNQGERNLRVEYQGISMVASAYDDEFEMSVHEKYEGLNMSAVTKFVADSSFLLAGKCDKGRLFFEKDIKLKNRTWMYLRVEFPQELTWAVDPLLHYVKDYQPFPI